jgi:hypothetical protein
MNLYVHLVNAFFFHANHRLNMELDLQSSFGLHVTRCAQLFSLVVIPQLPPPPHPPRIWAHIRGALLVT